MCWFLWEHNECDGLVRLSNRKVYDLIKLNIYTLHDSDGLTFENEEKTAINVSLLYNIILL